MAKIRIDGRVLVVRQTTRGLVEWQRQSGMKLTELSKDELAPYAPALAAFHALFNAGIPVNWDELLDRDVTEFELIQEPGDTRAAADAVEQPGSPAASDPGSGQEQSAKAAPGSTRSKKPKGGSKTR